MIVAVPAVIAAGGLNDEHRSPERGRALQVWSLREL